MCGILGLATVRGRALSVSEGTMGRMHDVMGRRGPDSAGLWLHENIALAHRRLIVVDRSEAAAQPMRTEDGRFAIVYNGELYNDAELRAELAAEGVRFRTASDTETVLHALAAWGPAGVARLRGMYALGFYDVSAGRLLLARDPLGIKPLYYALVHGGAEVVFASEPRAVLAHPGMAARPDLVTVSAYLTTIRTVMGARTLFEGVRTLRPGQALAADLNGAEVEIRPLPGPPLAADGADGAPIQERVRRAVTDSVVRHLRSDVPVCCLLSGGLDSSIVASVAKGTLGELHTYCSGASGRTLDDFHFAREVASHLGTNHTEAPVSREMFAARWGEMVAALGVPLSTPNEVAIHEVARTLREQGRIVALSGEGADELFGGYEGPMMDAARYEGLIEGGGEVTRAAGVAPGHFQLHANAWVPVSGKGAVLSDGVWKSVEGDDALLEFYRLEFEAISGERAGAERLQDHLRFHRRINLAGLLQRLDTATMLAGVEGRTPFADVRVCAMAEGLAIGEKFRMPAGESPARTKDILRRAFAADLPRSVVERAKASFPLPFETWVADRAGALRDSAMAREVFSEAAMLMVATEPSRLWRLAWPMINIALWAKVWWG